MTMLASHSLINVSYSYLVVPTESIEKLEYAGYSVAHGAGRRMTRSKALEKKSKISQSELLVTELGSRVICEYLYTGFVYFF